MQFRARETPQSRARPGMNNAFLQGLGSTILNPKIIGFLIVYFPQFLTRQESFLQQMLVLGPLFLLIVFLVFTLCVIAASQLRHRLNSSSGRQTFRRVSGLSLIGCGAYLATI
jgi:threonine/homoserine/homoserine lactone efflux protein